MLFEARVNIKAKNKNKSTALKRAAVNKHKKILKFLLYKGANVNESIKLFNNALYYAAALQGNKIIV